MARAILIVLDSVGIGGAPDAHAFGDSGSNTLGHIAQACALGNANGSDRKGPLHCPNMAALGLFDALGLASEVNHVLPHGSKATHGFHGAAREVSNGKDTPSGHWEIAGVPVRFDWGYFPHTDPAFPQPLLDAIYETAGLEGSLCNVHGSGTDVISTHGKAHLASGMPIFYTSADSVFQIAAHETHFGLERLYALCETVRTLVEDYNIGRVIARPFVGDSAANFERTGNRRDYSVLPPAPTLLDRVQDAGGRVIAVGKIGDIFAHQGVSEVRKASGNTAVGRTTLEALTDAGDGDLVFSNFVDFDMLYGHRRDVSGYAAALEAFDEWLPALQAQLFDDDLLIITADHGCDPTWTGTDHTREQVPVIGQMGGNGRQTQPVSIGQRKTFADIAQTLSAHLGVRTGDDGSSFLDVIATHA
ncbi:MAG: phosphopentomutase [Pseudomonadota bacterium]